MLRSLFSFLLSLFTSHTQLHLEVTLRMEFVLTLLFVGRQLSPVHLMVAQGIALNS
jgi:hypothetical protein